MGSGPFCRLPATAARLRVWSGLLCPLVSPQGQPHENRPASADVTVGTTAVRVDLGVALEPLVVGMNVAELQDTDDSPLSGLHDRLRAMDPVAFERAFRAVWPDLRDGFTLLPGETELTPEIAGLIVPPVGDEPLPRGGPGTENMTAMFLRHVLSGFAHFVPKGPDHVLFTFGLYLFSLRRLLTQVTAFTLAHTCTLALAALGYVTIPAGVVEPLIAASIVLVAVENVSGGSIGWTRAAVVCGLGLLHGLGFASVLGAAGPKAGRFAVGLIGFDIGGKLGQLSVILATFLLLGLSFGRRIWYRRAIAAPAPVLIAALGAWWTVERVFLA